MNQGQAQAASQLPLWSLWNGAEADEQIFPAFGAWKEAKEQLNQFLEDAVSNPGPTVLSLASQPATGKSTSLIKHIAERAYISKAPRLVLYIVSTVVEAQFIKSWLVRHSVATTTGSLGSRVQVEVVTVDMFSAGVSVEENWSRDLTIIFDINWYPTVDDEIALAFILHRAAELKTSVEKMCMGNHLAIVLLMSGYESSRTLRAIRRHVGNFTRINLLHHHHQYPDLKTLDENWEDTVRELVGSALAGGGRVVIEDDNWIQEDDLDIRRAEVDKDIASPLLPRTTTTITNITNLEEARVLKSADEVPYAVGLKDVNLVVCTGLAGKSLMIDPLFQQLIATTKRRMTTFEMARFLSWGIRSPKYTGPGVTFCVPQNWYEPEGSAALDREDMGKAWNQHLPILLLTVFDNWPSYRLAQLPIRPPADRAIFDDGLFRLCTLGCIIPGALGGIGGAYQCTELGRQILKIWKQTDKILDFHVTFLLARVAIMHRDPTASPLVVSVLIHMAAIAHRGTGAFMSVRRPVNMNELSFCFPPIIPEERRRAGGLWAALGLYMHCLDTFANGGFITLVPGITLDTRIGLNIRDWCRAFESAVLTASPHSRIPINWHTQRLSQAEMKAIDEELALAWFHRIVLFRPDPRFEGSDHVVDTSSYERFEIDMRTELLHASEINMNNHDGPDTTDRLYAIYENLQKMEDGADANEDLPTRFICSGLTWIPSSTFTKAVLEIGGINDDCRVNSDG
ncbi:hypothetical protein F4678DRAFT_474383 [Xylaria arbuscula]|nr:hypothetical protein F4678DRAFT_474383 [Xylaria arbuscula]